MGREPGSWIKFWVFFAFGATWRLPFEVSLYLRDICRLRSGLPGLSENICDVSIVGRLFEHARIYYF